MAKQEKKASATELADLYPPARIVAVKVRRPDTGAFEDAEVTVAEMDIVQIAQAVKALAPIREAIAPTSNFLFLAAEHPDEICAALGVAIRWPGSRVGMLGGASFGRVAAAVWECNQDFFGQAMAIVVSGGQVTPAGNGAGPRQSLTSEDTATSKARNASPSDSSSLQ